MANTGSSNLLSELSTTRTHSPAHGHGLYSQPTSRVGSPGMPMQPIPPFTELHCPPTPSPLAIHSSSAKFHQRWTPASAFAAHEEDSYSEHHFSDDRGTTPNVCSPSSFTLRHSLSTTLPYAVHWQVFPQISDDSTMSAHADIYMGPDSTPIGPCCTLAQPITST